ncbi:MAG TPA: DUF4147 domain-containing protein, partial [Gammaproteobacteria bacterium]|nr:DUF4147 domain-containing protein [Gammaproteobacteria bacterium]
MQSTPRRDLLAIFQAALRRVNGVEAVRQELVRDKYQDSSPVYLIAIGKAAAAMTEGALEVLGNRVVSGLVITKHGHLDGLNDERLQLIEADHPVPGTSSLAAGQELIDFCQSVPSGVRLLVLVSGGASSLVEVLPSGFSLQDLESLTRILLGSGLDISAINR